MPAINPEEIHIRKSTAADWSEIATLYPLAFPDEDLLPLVKELQALETGLLSLIAEKNGTIAGHIAFTLCGLNGQSDQAALLGPLAVTPGQQLQGIGRALIENGLQQMKYAGVKSVLVLGDPAYYGRFAFTAERNIEPPYPIPDEWRDAWQSVHLTDDGPGASAKLAVPEPWQNPALWGP